MTAFSDWDFTPLYDNATGENEWKDERIWEVKVPGYYNNGMNINKVAVVIIPGGGR